VLIDNELTRQLLEEAKKDMNRFRRKYRVLEALSKVFLEIDDALKDI
jgi:hypothetical protein